jgi:hypothetical protein
MRQANLWSIGTNQTTARRLPRVVSVVLLIASVLIFVAGVVAMGTSLNVALLLFGMGVIELALTMLLAGLTIDRKNYHRE